MRPLPARSDFADSNEYLIEMPPDAKPDRMGRVQFWAFHRVEPWPSEGGPGVNGVSGQVHFRTLDSFRDRYEGQLGHTIRHWSPEEARP
jgi:hypothetical protein